MRTGNGQGHREAHPSAVADLVPDGGATARLGARDQAGRRGLQRDERRRLRASFLRRPRGARGARHLPEGREAAGGLLRGRALHAAARELLPAADRVRRRRAGGASDVAVAARRPLRLRRAAAAGAAAALVGPPQPARRRPSSAPSPSPSPPRPAAASCRSGWPRSRPRSRAARRSSSATTRSSATSTRKRKVDPYHLLYQGGQFYLVGYSHERDDIRVFRLSRIREKISYASKAEHDFSPPEDFDPWRYAHRADWQLGDRRGHRRGLDLGADRLAGRARLRPLRHRRDGEAVRQAVARRLAPRAGCRASSSRPSTRSPRQLVAWVLGPGRERARCWSPRELVDEASRAPRACSSSAIRRASRLRRRRRRTGAPRAAAAAAERERRRRRPSETADPPRAVRAADRAGGHPDPVRAQRASGRRSRRCASGSRSPSRSCATTSTC